MPIMKTYLNILPVIAVTCHSVAYTAHGLYIVAAQFVPQVLDMSIKTSDAMVKAARKFSAMGAKGIMLRGGHVKDNSVTALLYYDGFKQFYTSLNMAGWQRHGVGAAMSAAIATRLALGDSLSSVAKERACTICREFLESKSQYCRPEQDSDVIAVYQCGDRVLYHLEKKILENFSDILRNGVGLYRFTEFHCDREHKTCDHRSCRRKECTEHIEEQYEAEFAVQLALPVAERADDQDEDQDRRHCAERSDEHASEDSDPGPAFQRKAENRADHKTDHDPHDQTCVRILFDNTFQCIHISFPLSVFLLK